MAATGSLEPTAEASEPGDGSRPPATGSGGQTAESAESNTPEGQDTMDQTPIVGANLNGRPHRVDDALGLIDASGTTWVRAFLDVRKKLESGVDPREDPDVLALRRVAREKDCKLIVSLKWDFKANWGDKEPIVVPAPGSPLERDLFRHATRCLEAIGDGVEVVVLGNEPMWETLDRDVKVRDPPIVAFTRRAKDYLVEHGDHGDPTYLVGAFNRSDDEHVREQEFRHFYRGMADFVREDDDVDGVDLHLHFDALEQAEAMVAGARELFPDEVIVATEFSPVWRYDRYVDRPIGESAAGERFAREHDLSPETTAIEYFEQAKRDPVSPSELADFYEAMPWYNVHHVADMYDLFDAYDVRLGTFGFLAGEGMRNEDWSDGWSPFHINSLYQPALISAEAGIGGTANRPYLEDYRERTGRGGPSGSG